VDNRLKTRGIYVEIPIRASLDEVWNHTQQPSLHEQWDLRFTRIQYLPKLDEADPQRFLYSTRLGFGLKISGQGESLAIRSNSDGEATSSLKFWSDQPISLIRAGSGYWKYIPAGNVVRFITWYDYQVRFGPAGRLFDRLVFRPLIGWATAWSFDVLRIWLEQGIPPKRSRRGGLINLTARCSLAAVWVYQGLAPKLLFPDSGELAIMKAAGILPGAEPVLLAAFGIGEILFGIAFLLPWFGKSLHILNLLLLSILGLGALLTQPEIFIAPFNPAALTLAMWALSLIALLNLDDLPSAGRCLRKALA